MAGGFDPKQFSTVPYVQKVEKPWGYEIIYTRPDAPAVGKILHVNAGKRLSLQYHDVKIETLCLYQGSANIVLSNELDTQIEIPMEPLKGYMTVQGQVHRIIGVTDCDILESSMPEVGNTFRLQDDVGRETETEEMRKTENRGWKKGLK